DLTNKRILNLAKGLAPAYVRVSGTWTNATYFQDNDEPIQPAPEGFLNVLTRSQWKGVLEFLEATDSELVTSFAVSNGVRNQDGIWTPVEAQKLVNYTKSLAIRKVWVEVSPLLNFSTNQQCHCLVVS